MTPAPASRPRPGWDAHLALRFARHGADSRLVHREHRGPLVVQRALHPEGSAVCQAIVVHPPGGIAGGDRLALDLDVGDGAHAQITTPGAAKWYRSGGAQAIQRIRARLGSDAALEWLPQEAIVFDGARADTATRVEMAQRASFIGWDVVTLGRVASGERFARGAFRQRLELVRDGALVWAERADFAAGDPVLASPAGLNGVPMFGTLVAAASGISGELASACRQIEPGAFGALQGAVTRLPGVLVARCRGASNEAARGWFAALWNVLRPALLGRHAVAPRIWQT